MTALSDDSQRAERRLIVLEEVARTTTHELPLPALAAKLSTEDVPVFPEDRQAVEQSLKTDHVPAFVDAGLLDLNTDTKTIEYVGPPELAEQLGE
jgi:hypothetical protein